MLPEKCWHCFMANFYGKFYGKWRSSNVGLVIDYACDFGGAGGMAGAVCVCVGRGGVWRGGISNRALRIGSTSIAMQTGMTPKVFR